jgi:hypothetical protein
MFGVPHRRQFARAFSTHAVLPSGKLEEPALAGRAAAAMHPEQNEPAARIDKRPRRWKRRLPTGAKSDTHFQLGPSSRNVDSNPQNPRVLQWRGTIAEICSPD